VNPGAVSRAARWRPGGSPRADLLVVAGASLIAVVAGALLMWSLGVVGGDTPAHAYKTELVRSGESILWDNRWYGGVYGPIDYGPVFYWVSAVVPMWLVTLASAVALPVLLFLYLKALGNAHRFWAAVSLAGVMTVYLTYGQGPFLFAMSLALAGMTLAAAGRPGWAVLPLGVAVFTNPLALLVSVPFLIADPLARRERRRAYAVLAAGLAPVLLLEAVVMVLFSQPTWYLAELSILRMLLVFCAVGVGFAMASRAGGVRFWRAFFILYAVACLASFALPQLGLGNNVARTYQLLGLSLLIAVEGVRLPRWVTVPIIVLIAVAQLGTPVGNLTHRQWYAASTRAFWDEPLAALARVDDGQHRVHVVATKKHSEAYFVPLAGYAMTRGWFRQSDAVHNELFTREFGERALGEREYVDWLRRMGVEYVLWPHVTLDFSSAGEPAILASSIAFSVAAEGRDWTLYRFNAPQRLVVDPASPDDPAAGATVVALDTASVTLDLATPGDYEVRTSWSPYWRVTDGAAELSRSDEGFLSVRAPRAGRLVLECSLTAGAVGDRLRAASGGLAGGT
jgi:hypothetical protein